ncbi:MAG: rod shape-determining protein [Victivallales bacterium]|nr:rod shape-determining protein [Victivallales bacterium]
MTEDIATNKQFTIIDLGTEAIRVIIARLENDGNLKILGCSDTLSNRSGNSAQLAGNIRKGIVCNVQDVTKLLHQALGEAMLKAGTMTSGGNVYLGITAGVQSQNASMTLKTVHSKSLITQDDMTVLTRKVREHYDFLATSENRTLQTYTRFFQLDDKREVYDVVNMASHEITANVQGALCSCTMLATLEGMVKEVVGVTPITLYLPMAIGYALDLEEDLANGVLLIDIGAGVTSFVVSRGVCFVHAGHIPVGCNHIENDLMQAFDIEWNTARNIMRKMGSELNANIVNKNDGRKRKATVENRWSSDSRGMQRQRTVPVSSIERVAYLRVHEILSMVKEQLMKNDSWHHLGGGVILSGGGALIPGICETAEQIFGRKVRVAETPKCNDRKFIYNDARDIVPYGLLKMSVYDYQIREASANEENRKKTPRQFLADIMHALVNW